MRVVRLMLAHGRVVVTMVKGDERSDAVSPKNGIDGARTRVKGKLTASPMRVMPPVVVDDGGCMRQSAIGCPQHEIAPTGQQEAVTDVRGNGDGSKRSTQCPGQRTGHGAPNRLRGCYSTWQRIILVNQ